MEEIKSIKSVDEAKQFLTGKIAEAKKSIIDVKNNLGDFTPEDVTDASNKINSAIDAGTREAMQELTPRQWQLIGFRNKQDDLENLEETAKLELVTPSGKFLLVPLDFEGLISPAGFHPDELVFIQPDNGALVDILPRSTNMKAYDFTNR